MFAVRRLILIFVAAGALLVFAGCSGDSGPSSDGSEFTWQPVFGDGTNDTSETIAIVGGLEISLRDLKMFIEELPDSERAKYNGPDGERLALDKMIETVIMVRSAVEMELYNDTDVARTLIAQRRATLDSAMRNYGILRGRKPSDDELREYFEKNRDKYRQNALLNVSHIEVSTKEIADEVYARLMKGGRENHFTLLVNEYSENEVTKAEDGNCGWFNQGGQMPIVKGGSIFTRKCFELEDGINPPVMVSGRWHIIDVHAKKPERPMTFKEARNQLEVQLLPGFQDALMKDFLREARKRFDVTLQGRFEPGQGLTPEQLFVQGMNVADPRKRIDLFKVIWTDFPESKEADDAMFMAANVSLEAFQDYKIAERYLRILLEEYPDSELAPDAQYLMDNLANPAALNPTSIEELRKSQQ